ncbi:Nitric oxide reductase subunit B [compost metagenome]
MLTAAGVVQVLLQRWAEDGSALPFMATVEHLQGLFWARLVSGLGFFAGLLCYLASFRQRARAALRAPAAVVPS